jgi:hypothetical protein
VAQYAFDTEGSLYYPRSFSGADGTVVCQVIGRREAQPRPFSEVAEQVRADYRRQAALERARTFAEKVKSAVAETGFEEGLTAMRERLRNLLTDAGLEPPESLLPITESGFFARNARAVPELTGSHPRLVEVAFELEGDRPGLVVEEAPEPKCYVLQVVDRRDASSEPFVANGPFSRLRYRAAKQQAVQKRWMEGLLAAAELRRKAGD